MGFIPCIYTKYCSILASFPSPAQLSVACSMEKQEKAWYIFSREWRHTQGKLWERGRHVNHKKTSPVHMHWSTSIPSWKMEAHEGTFMSLFTRQSGGQKVSPSQNSEDAQQQFSHARPRSLFLPAFYPWHHSREKMYQALSRFSALQVTESWEGPGNKASSIHHSY